MISDFLASLAKGHSVAPVPIESGADAEIFAQMVDNGDAPSVILDADAIPDFTLFERLGEDRNQNTDASDPWPELGHGLQETEIQQVTSIHTTAPVIPRPKTDATKPVEFGPRQIEFPNTTATTDLAPSMKGEPTPVHMDGPVPATKSPDHAPVQASKKSILSTHILTGNASQDLDPDTGTRQTAKAAGFPQIDLPISDAGRKLSVPVPDQKKATHSHKTDVVTELTPELTPQGRSNQYATIDPGQPEQIPNTLSKEVPKLTNPAKVPKNASVTLPEPAKPAQSISVPAMAPIPTVQNYAGPLEIPSTVPAPKLRSAQNETVVKILDHQNHDVPQTGHKTGPVPAPIVPVTAPKHWVGPVDVTYVTKGAAAHHSTPPPPVADIEPRQQFASAPIAQSQPVAPIQIVPVPRVTAQPLARFPADFVPNEPRSDVTPTFSIAGVQVELPLPVGIAPAPIAHPSLDLGPRIALAVASAAQHLHDRPVEILLNPEELGRVRMTMQAGDGTMAVAVVVERPETLELLRRHIDLLAGQLRELGYQDLSFEFSGDAEFGFGDNQSSETGKRNNSAHENENPNVDQASPDRIFIGTDGGIDIRL